MSRKTKLTLGREEDETFIPSSHPSTTEDVRDLEQRFDMQLYSEFALENGPCPKRRRIYDDLLNELIRITKVQCSERGNLLERVRNEYHQWMRTYEELYSSSMAYAMRQYLYRMEERKNLEIKIEGLEDECQKLRDELQTEKIHLENATAKLDPINRKDGPELRTLRNNANFLRAKNARLKNDIENRLKEVLDSPIFDIESIDLKKEKK